MKRRLITGVYLSLATLAACQTQPAGGTDTVSQEVSAACDAKMPPTPYWDGKALPPTGPTEIYLFYPDLERVGEWVVVRVDYEKGEIPFGTRTKGSAVGSLLSKLDEAAQFAGGRQPTPPQPVHDWNQAAALIEWARLAAPDLGGAIEGGMCRAQ